MDKTTGKKCVVCGAPLTGNQRKYCSPKCSSIGSHVKYEHVCEMCGKIFVGYKDAKFCSSSCASKYGVSLYVKKWKNGEKLINPNVSFPKSIRKYLLDIYNNKCQICGFEGYNKTTGNSILQIHHKDGNSGNNSVENLQLLCPNCHAMTENFMALNKGKSARKERYKKTFFE